MKIFEKIKRQIIKRYAVVLRKLIVNYELDLYFKDNQGIISKIYPHDDMRHIIQNKTHLDGTVLNLINDFDLNNLDLCIDIGANLGFVSAVLAKRSKRVIAFEPEPKNLERFNDLIRNNQIKNIEVEPIAVADKTGKIKFYTSQAHAHHSLGLAHTSQSAAQFIEVDVVTLDEFCEKKQIKKIDCLKVDVEGFEYEVFQGAKELFKNKCVKYVIFEISHGVMTRLKKDPTPIFNFLLDHGFEIYTAKNNKISRDQILDYVGQDLLAVLS